MIRKTIYDGDIFTSAAQALVIPVNCAGAMGAGLARDFRERFPEVASAYRSLYAAEEIRIGAVTSFDWQERLFVYFPTKQHWKGKSRLEDIDDGLRALRELITDRAVTSIAVPALGCGCGGLSWSLVEPRIRANLQNLSGVDIEIYAPMGQKPHRGRAQGASA